ncbi:MAG: hypothetical protein WCJ09_14080 [Planctomycetota bacterium]
MAIHRIIASAITLVAITYSTAYSQSKTAAIAQLSVDAISLKSGKVVRGIAIAAPADGPMIVATDRQWLQKHLPDLFLKATVAETDRRKLANRQLIERLQKRLAAPVAEPGLAFFLKQELERAESQRESPLDPPQFVWLELERETINRFTPAAADRKRVAMWAWSEFLPNVESRDHHDLQRELTQRKVDFTANPPDLSDRVGPRLQDDREWAARIALVEYTLGKPLDFQGTGDLLIRTDGDQKSIDLAPLLTRTLNSQVDSLLKELTGEPRAATSTPENKDWLKSATKAADAESVRGLRATRVEVQTDGLKAVVQTAFGARMPDGSWDVIWSHRESQDGTKPRVDTEAKIAKDPRILQITDTIKSLGAGGDDQIRQAIRFGAATMAAQQTADSRFFEFRDRYTKHLDGPPLIWGK